MRHDSGAAGRQPSGGVGDLIRPHTLICIFELRPQVCVATVALLVGSIMAGQAASVLAAGWRLLAAVAALHAGAPRSCWGLALPCVHLIKEAARDGEAAPDVRLSGSGLQGWPFVQPSRGRGAAAGCQAAAPGRLSREWLVAKYCCGWL